MPDQKISERRVFLGIGDAVLRLVHVERMVADGAHPPPPLLAERDLIVQALNQQYQLDLGMDCDADGIPDSIDDDVQVLTHAAQTSCCRIKEAPASRTSPTTSSRKTDTSPEIPLSVEGKPKGGFLSSLFGSGSESE